MPRRSGAAAPLIAIGLRAWAAEVHARVVWLTDLDAAIGDGDHGINLDRGLTALAIDLDTGALRSDDPTALLTGAGRRVIGSVGGASGALYGRALVRAGEAISRDTDGEHLPALALGAAVASIVELGHAAPGDKTMLDALVPALEALRAGPVGEAASARLARAADAADAGALATIPLIARKGRASYLGERSIGHLDPGAASSAMLVRCMATALAGR